MNRYKRGWFLNNTLAVRVNLYKNDSGEVFISWEGDYERVYQRWDVEHKEYVWTFDDDGLDSICGEREATPEEYDNHIKVTLKYKYVDGVLIEPVFHANCPRCGALLYSASSPQTFKEVFPVERPFCFHCGIKVSSAKVETDENKYCEVVL